MSEDYDIVKKLYERSVIAEKTVSEMKDDLKDLLESFSFEGEASYEEERADKIAEGIDDMIEKGVDLIDNPITSSFEVKLGNEREFAEKEPTYSQESKLEGERNIAKKDPIKHVGLGGGRELTTIQKEKMQKGATAYRDFVRNLKKKAFIKDFKGTGVRTMESVLYELSSDIGKEKFDKFLEDLNKDKPMSKQLDYGLKEVVDFRKCNNLLKAPKLRKAVKRVFE